MNCASFLDGKGENCQKKLAAPKIICHQLNSRLRAMHLFQNRPCLVLKKAVFLFVSRGRAANVEPHAQCSC